MANTLSWYNCVNIGDGKGDSKTLKIAKPGSIQKPKLRGLLKAMRKDGQLHLRPLCCVDDLVLAMHVKLRTSKSSRSVIHTAAK